MRGTTAAAVPLFALAALGLALGSRAADPAPPAAALQGELAYVALTEGSWQLWLRDLARGTTRQLTSWSRDARAPRWGPGGTLLVRTHRQQLWSVTPGSPPAPWQPELWPARDPHWVAGGPGVVLAQLRTNVSDHSDLISVGEKGTPPRILLQGQRALRVHPTWSPDGSALVYVHSLGAYGSELRRLADPVAPPPVQPADRATPLPLVAGAGHVLYPAWSPDGTRIAFAGNEAGDFDLWVLELATGQRRRLATSPGLDTHPAWSPDGAWLAFTSRRRGQLEIWVVSATGAGPWPLVAGSRPVQEPAWR